MTDNFPPVALSCGDPAGIGPEIAVKAWEILGDELPFVWVGDPSHLPAGAPHRVIDRPDQARQAASQGVPVLSHAFSQAAIPGDPHPENARNIIDVIRRSVGLVLDRKASALCTAPISKHVLAKFGDFKFPGHTEYLAHLGGADHAVMMLAASELRVVPTTIHIPLTAVPKALTAELLRKTIMTTIDALKNDFGITSPRISVSGLNPHAGEDGVIGTEDQNIIQPVCDDFRRSGFSVTGPLPADTMFHAAAREEYDAAIAMYHDQALIPIKTLAFDRGVNVTLGLPFVRTSPDHGTAYDIAGKDRANPTSLIEALRLADAMARRRLEQPG